MLSNDTIGLVIWHKASGTLKISKRNFLVCSISHHKLLISYKFLWISCQNNLFSSEDSDITHLALTWHSQNTKTYCNWAFLSLGMVFVCLGGAVPLRQQRASYFGPNVITLYKLGVTEAGGAHRLMTFYCYCSATIKLFTTPASAAEGFYLVSEREGEGENTKTANWTHRQYDTEKMINLSIKLLFWCYIFCCAFSYHHITMLHRDLVYITLHWEKNLICVLGWLYKCVLVFKHVGQYCCWRWDLNCMLCATEMHKHNYV